MVLLGAPKRKDSFPSYRSYAFKIQGRSISTCGRMKFHAASLPSIQEVVSLCSLGIFKMANVFCTRWPRKVAVPCHVRARFMWSQLHPLSSIHTTKNSSIHIPVARFRPTWSLLTIFLSAVHLRIWKRWLRRRCHPIMLGQLRGTLSVSVASLAMGR